MDKRLKVYLEAPFVSCLTGRPTTKEAVAQTLSYNHDPHTYFKAMVERQRERARQGRVYWGYNAAGELVPLPLEAMLARL